MLKDDTQTTYLVWIESTLYSLSTCMYVLATEGGQAKVSRINGTFDRRIKKSAQKFRVIILGVVCQEFLGPPGNFTQVNACASATRITLQSLAASQSSPSDHGQSQWVDFLRQNLPCLRGLYNVLVARVSGVCWAVLPQTIPHGCNSPEVLLAANLFLSVWPQ